MLRLAGERAARKREHWQAVAVAACEQSGRAVVPTVEPVALLADWLVRGAIEGQRLVLSPRPGVPPLRQRTPGAICALSGPEGGLSPAEEAAALAAGFEAVGLGPRVLRADTAPLVLLAWIGLQA